VELDVSGKVAMVLGAAGGLGGAATEALLTEGATVIACDVNDAGLKELVDRAPDPTRVLPFTMNLGDLASVDDVLRELEKAALPVDILVNITGGPPPTTVLETATDAWAEHFSKLVTPVVHLTSRLLPHMRSQQWGRVITSTSSGVISPIPNLALSNALRSTLVGWSKTLANEVAADGITVNMVVPGRIGTARIDELDRARATRIGKSVDDVRRASVATIPAGRYGRPEEFGALVAFLSGTGASYITGSMIRVDGGMLSNV
jgi:3-oxoacyl-[acyl-carrier protein] reductase